MNYIDEIIIKNDTSHVLKHLDFLMDHNMLDGSGAEYLNKIKAHKGGKELIIQIIDELPKHLYKGSILSVIYDIKELESHVIYLLSNRNLYNNPILANQIKYFVLNTTFGKDLIEHNYCSIVDGAYRCSYNRGEENENTIYELMANDQCFENSIAPLLSNSRLKKYSLYLIKNKPELANTFIDNHFDDFFYINKSKEYINVSLFNEEEQANQVEPLKNIEDYLTSLFTLKVDSKYINDTIHFINHNYPKNNTLDILSRYNRIDEIEYFKTNTDEKLRTCLTGQSEIIHRLYSNNLLEVPLIEKYKFILNLLKSTKNDQGRTYYAITDSIFSNNLDDYIARVFETYGSKGDTFNYLGSGATTLAFRFDDYVVKLGASRFEFTCPKHYRIAPSIIRKEIKDDSDKPAFYIEVQKYYTQENITSENIYELLVDLYNDGVELSDPNALAFAPDNFAFLPSYQECNSSVPIKGEDKGYIYLNKQIKISRTFKSSPLVLIDTDLAYIKGDSNIQRKRASYYSPTISHKDAIEGYERHKKKQLIK